MLFGAVAKRILDPELSSHMALRVEGKPFDSTILMDMYPTGQLLKGAVDAEGNQKDAALLVGIKLDLEAEIHLTARVRGDIAVGLY